MVGVIKCCFPPIILYAQTTNSTSITNGFAWTLSPWQDHQKTVFFKKNHAKSFFVAGRWWKTVPDYIVIGCDGKRMILWQNLLKSKRLREQGPGMLSGLPVLRAWMITQSSTKPPRSVTGNHGMPPATSAKNVPPWLLRGCMKKSYFLRYNPFFLIFRRNNVLNRLGCREHMLFFGTQSTAKNREKWQDWRFAPRGSPWQCSFCPGQRACPPIGRFSQ